ncbi:MAG: phage portal protein [Treponema sp.]|nr:phage portal protein [Treponema sp.]
MGIIPKPNAMIDSNGVRTTRFYGQKWPDSLTSISPALVVDHDAIRNQVRTLSQTSIHAASLINRDVDTTIDSGLMLSPECQHEVLGITPEEAEKWNSDVALRFDLFAQDHRASLTGTLNLYQAQRLWERCIVMDGECFVTLAYFADPTLLSPLRFGTLDASQIRESAYTWTAGFINIADGIIRNEYGEETGCQVWQQGPGKLIPEMKTIPRVHRGGRIMMTHGYEPQFPGQGRGFSPLAVSVHDLEKLSVLALAETEKTINQSNIAFTVKNTGDRPTVDPFGGTPDFGVPPGYGPGSVAFGNNPVPPEGAQNVTEESLEPLYTGVPHTDIWKPGSAGVFSLPGRQELVPFANTAPGTVFNIFVDSQISYIAAALGQSVETVLMKFSNNYSASRATLILCWRIALQRRYNLACYHLDPIYEMWLSEEIAAGRVSAPGWQDPRMRAAWLSIAGRVRGSPLWTRPGPRRPRKWRWKWGSPRWRTRPSNTTVPPPRPTAPSSGRNFPNSRRRPGPTSRKA